SWICAPGVERGRRIPHVREQNPPDRESTSTGWSDPDLMDPHAMPDKARRVRAMFDSIAHAYDLNNRVHSLGIDQRWRRRAVATLAPRPGEHLLDLACGTGDLALEIARACPDVSITGLDFSQPMLTRAVDKADGGAGSLSAGPRLGFAVADVLNLPIADHAADGAIIGFGLRNLTDPAGFMAECLRVIRPGGRLVVLEFCEPAGLMGRMYRFYTHHILPRTAGWIARDTHRAYRYLPRSVETFASPDEIADWGISRGWSDARIKRLTFGAVFVLRLDSPVHSAG
ncbi:MAG: ubiquinone/menaquinone biosynthesis methyltransferase, partial [Phycisphaeraceae bacterium]|nr:ubiquinone/menaquinone biosynthesis methyltransferase [Phycisphaeraceae bacterium]